MNAKIIDCSYLFFFWACALRPKTPRSPFCVIIPFPQQTLGGAA